MDEILAIGYIPCKPGLRRMVQYTQNTRSLFTHETPGRGNFDRHNGFNNYPKRRNPVNPQLSPLETGWERGKGGEERSGREVVIKRLVIMDLRTTDALQISCYPVRGVRVSGICVG